jgi:hypothetical protein
MRAAIARHGLIAVLAFWGCAPKDEAPDAPAPKGDPRGLGLREAEDRRWWAEKAARALRKGEGLRDEVELQTLATLDEADAAMQLMSDARFYETVVDFNLYFFGFKSDKLGYPSAEDPISYFRSTLRFPHAIEGARLLREGGDYLGMLARRVRVYEGPLEPVYDPVAMKFVVDAGPIRAEAYERIRGKLDGVVAMLESGEMDRSRYCLTMLEIAFVTEGGGTGWPNHLDEAMRASPELAALQAPCRDAGGQVGTVPPASAAEHARAYRARFETLVAYAAELDPHVYAPKTEAELRTADLERLGLDPEAMESASLDWFWKALPNSSTNFNRKRAAYVLKRFFCDDLTPLDIVLPEAHAGGDKHASDPGCMSCHYKLDPMAGYLRYHGSDGSDYQGQTSIYFDDGARRAVAEYVTEWQDAETGDWKIGLVRSATDEALNDRPASADPTVDDLFALLRRAPEVKQCLVRRMFEYFVGERQALDPGWLAQLSREFAAEAETDSAAAFKATVAKLVTSRTFKTRDPLSEECYDRADGADEGSAPPCKIAHIVEESCATCHRDAGAMDGLDLTGWEPRPDGKRGFPHVRAGEEVGADETMRAIMERLSSGDPAVKMPLNKHMDATARDALYLWLEKALGRGAEEG